VGTLSLDGVAPSQMVGVSASVNLRLHHKVPEKGHKTVVVWFLVNHHVTSNFMEC